jgi:hypothetical protein
MRQLLQAVLSLLILASPAAAVSLQDVTLKSPITRTPFDVKIPADSRDAENLSDMGADMDGCRHSSLQSEYEFGIVVDPTSHFAALASEWNPRTGAFLYPIDDQFRAWVLKELASEHTVDVNSAYATVVRQARAAGQVPPDRQTFQIPQSMVRLEKRYRLAMQCYEARRVRSSVLAKVALQGAWALRAYLNISLGNQRLDGGYQEVDEQVKRHVEPGEAFKLDKWLPVYREILDSGSGMTDEGFFVAGITCLGLTLRDGDLAEANRVVALLEERYRDKDKAEFLRGLVRERKTTIAEYLKFLDIAYAHFRLGIMDEQFNRSQLPVTMLATAECLRRSGRTAQAMEWYFALTRLPETEPKLREDIRKQGKAVAPEAPFHVQVGWIADAQYAKLKAAGNAHNGEIGGSDRGILLAIVAEGLGSADFVNPGWKPVVGANDSDCASLMSRVGDAVLIYAFRTGNWPLTLGELWDRDFLDRNQVNRFRDPVNGEPLVYAEPGMPFDRAPKDLVLVATKSAIDTPVGKRYGAYLADKRPVWSATPIEVGKAWGK